MANWKTTLGGLGVGLPLFGLALTAGLAGDWVACAEKAAAGLAAIFTGYHAQDAK